MDFEQIEMENSCTDSVLQKSDYAQVIFNNIAEIYSTGGDIECHYTVTPSLVPSGRDWVGLYKVGWRSSRDYVYFEWSPQPKDSEATKEVHSTVLFKGKNLPKDDGEFYQFCYVTSQGHVRGASTPFQFKRPLAEEYVEVEAEDGELLVVKTRTMVLQERLQQASQQRQALTKDLELLEKERGTLLSKLVDMEKKLAMEQETNEELKTKIKEQQEHIATLATEAKDMQLAHDGLREKINVLNQEKECMEKRLDDNDVYLRSLQEKIKALINEKDALTGKNKALEEEKELFKNHFTSSESTIKCYLAETERMKEQLAAAEAQCAHLRTEVDKLTGELNMEKHKVQGQVKIIEADKEHMACLEERARNAEDKLTAAEHCKILLNDEALNVQEVCKKVSADLEKSKSEAFSLKSQLSQQEEVYQAETQKLQGELSRCQHMLEDKQMEKMELEKELEKTKEKLQELSENKEEEEAGPLFALQTAHINLKERYTKVKHANEDLKKQLQELVHKQCVHEEKEQELQREIRDLKERLVMGQDEYKAQFIQCRRLQAQLRRTNRQGSKSESPEKVKDDFVEVKVVTSDQGTDYEESEKVTVCTLTETSDTGEKEIQTEAAAAASGGEEPADLTKSELQEQLEDLGRELQHRNAKKFKYKQLLQEEKEKNQFLQRHYFDELKKKEEELRYLAAKLADKEQQMKTMQNTIDSLSREAKKSSSPQALQSPTFLPLTPMRPVPPPALYPNPYAEYQPALSAPRRETSPMPPTPDDVKEFDPLNEEDAIALQQPMHPLPPPMTPEMTPGAKVAAIRAKQNESGVGLNGIMDMCDSVTEEKQPLEAGASAAAGTTDNIESEAAKVPTGRETRIEIEAEEETEFVDAQGEPQKMCPICTITFPAETSDMVVSDHIDDHYGPVCPICHRQFEKGTEQYHFQEHVEGHFD